MENKNEFKSLIFCDVDGVLNHDLFYEEQYKHLHKNDGIPLYKVVKKYLRKLLKSQEISTIDYYKSQIDLSKIKLLNDLCVKTNSVVVLSASMRNQWDVQDLQVIFKKLGATFTIIDKTGNCECRNRGCEIKKWLTNNVEEYFDASSHNFYHYAIIDDGIDFLLNQREHFFHVDSYFGLTQKICNEVEKFLNI